jgi:hypothetical protein
MPTFAIFGETISYCEAGSPTADYDVVVLLGHISSVSFDLGIFPRRKCVSSGEDTEDSYKCQCHAEGSGCCTPAMM